MIFISFKTIQRPIYFHFFFSLLLCFLRFCCFNASGLNKYDKNTSTGYVATQKNKLTFSYQCKDWLINLFKSKVMLSKDFKAVVWTAMLSKGFTISGFERLFL